MTKKRMQLSIDAEMLSKLDAVCALHCVSRSALISTLISREYLAMQSQGARFDLPAGRDEGGTEAFSITPPAEDEEPRWSIGDWED